MSVSSYNLRKARDAALDCMSAFSGFIRCYANLDCQVDTAGIIAMARTHVQTLCDIICRFDRWVTPDLLDFIIMANSTRTSVAEFSGFRFPTFHEVACAAAEVAYVKLSVISEDLPNCSDDRVPLDESIQYVRRELLLDWNNFQADHVLTSIQLETAVTESVLRKSTAGCDSTSAEKDAATEERDEYIYRRCCEGVSYSEIATDLQAYAGVWDLIESPNGIRGAGNAYAKRHHLPLPPRRRSAKKDFSSRPTKPR